MAKNKTKKKKNSQEPPCGKCDALCCRYVAVEIDAPQDAAGYDNIRWYLLHHKVQVFVSHDDEWFVEFVTPCEWLGENNRCSHYEKRPLICRAYGTDAETDCEFVDTPYKQLFKTIEDFDSFLERDVSAR